MKPYTNINVAGYTKPSSITNDSNYTESCILASSDFIPIFLNFIIFITGIWHIYYVINYMERFQITTNQRKQPIDRVREGFKYETIIVIRYD